MHLSILTTKSEHGLAEGSVWEWFQKEVLKNTKYTVYDIDTTDVKFHDRVLLLGDKAARLYLGPDTNIFTHRGTVSYIHNKIPTVCTFNLDEAYNFKATAKELETRDDTFSKDRGSTSRKNHLFWIRADTEKLIGDIKPQDTGIRVFTCPDLKMLCGHLSKLNNARIYLDSETDMETDTLDCIGFSVDDSPKVFVVPCYRWNGKLAYPPKELYRFLATLMSALLRNQVIIHNCMYDLIWLATHLRLPFGADIYDTMVAHKRILPEIEKSLGHCISLYTFQPYHKDEHQLARSAQSEAKLWQYNAKDVYAMRLVHKGQLAWAARHRGMLESIKQANASLYPYLLATLRGLRVDIGRLAAAKMASDRRIKQIKRIILILIGDKAFNPDSPTQLVKYFHTKLAYKVMGRSKTTGNPSLGGKALYQLALKYDNPLIPAILYYREIVKERGMYNFCNLQYPWDEI
jgi:hypothetical protein